MTFWQRFKRSTAQTQVNIVCTALVMLATIAYAIIAGFQLVALNGQIALMQGTLEEQKRSGEQSTQQLWAAIGNLNWAARSADWQQKVSKKSAEDATQQSTKALKTTITNARNDMRAYIVTTNHREDVRSGCDYAQHHCVDFQYVNVGKTPAVDIQIVAQLHVDSPIGGGGNFENELRRVVQSSKYDGLSGSVLGTNIPASGLATEVGQPDMIACKQAYHGPPCGHAIYGLIRYKDVFGDEHETGFCTYFVDGGPRSGESCHFGNWFDVRPPMLSQKQ